MVGMVLAGCVLGRSTQRVVNMSLDVFRVLALSVNAEQYVHSSLPKVMFK